MGKLKFGDRRKKEDDGFDIITDIKEPFSFANFFETQVMERARRFKALLADKGILFFLTSPFQSRSRLVAQMVILCIGILFGVVPRASSLMSQTQNKAYASEIEGLKEKSVGSLTITPAASSNYKRMHLLAFIIEGNSLPSSASKYEVHIARSYGATDWNKVTYSWDILPVDDTRRILLLGIDQREQPSGFGAFQLYIQLAGEEIEDYAKTPFEITLSSAQETSDLYNKNGIHLSAITEAICGTGNIQAKQEEFEEALEEYRTKLEQTEAMPIDITVAPTVEDLEALCLFNRAYRTLTDSSTTDDIERFEQEEAPEFDADIILTSNNIQYDETFITELESSETVSDEDTIIFDAFDTLDSAKANVVAAMKSVNAAAMNWYDTLTNCKLILNQSVDVDAFPYRAQCTDTIQEKIKYIKDSGNDDEKEPAASGDPASEPAVSGSASDVQTEPDGEGAESD